MPYTYEYPRPALTVDCVIFAYDQQASLRVLLIERAGNPFQGHWALPGGFVDEGETLEAAALRELEEETGMKDVFIEQLYTFGDPGRDPRGQVVSVAHFALVNPTRHPVKAASDARTVAWHDIEHLPSMAFDHQQIIETAIRRLRAKVRYQPVGFELLPEQFTLSQLQDLYETILGLKSSGLSLNKRNFRTRILKLGVLEETSRQAGVAHRPAMRYRFNRETYEQLLVENRENLLRRGIDFEI